MVRWPTSPGFLRYAAAWLVPWRSIYRVRPRNSDLVFVVHRRDAVGRLIAKYGAHEPAMTAWIARHLASSPKGIVVDVGANIGWHTVHAARQAAVEMVVAFEPDAFNAWLLDRNLSLNRIGNVVVDNCALGAGPGIARLHQYKPSNRGRHSVVADYGLGSKAVPRSDLDRALDNLGLGERRVLALKIDVEGYEPAVIEGAARTLARTDVVILEYSPALSRAGGLSAEDMAGRLKGAGFAPFMLDGDGALSPFDDARLRAFDGQTDIIWTRKPG